MYRLKLIHSHPPRMRRLVTWWATWWFIAFWPPTQIWLRLHSFFFWNNTFLPFSNSSDFCCPDLCRRIWTYAREDNKSSTWDSTRLQTVVFVMWSFWSFVSCPAFQNAIRNNFCTSCLQPIIFENSMQQNVSSHIATEIAILSQSDFNSRKNFNGCNIQKNEDTIFLTNQRAAFCSRAPHCLLSTSPTYT